MLSPCIDSPKRWPWFVCAALVMLVLVVYVVSGRLAYGYPANQLTVAGGMLRTLLHFLLIQLCHGTSSGKVYYLLVFTIAVFIRLALAKPVQRELRVDGRDQQVAMIGAIALTFIGLASSLLSHVLYIWTYSLPVGWASWHWKHGINSVTSITHIHTSKAAIAWLCEVIGASQAHERFDTGYVYLDVVPWWLTATIGLSFIGAIVCWLIIAPLVIGIGSRHDVMARAWVFALAGASLTKSILDGGPLAYDAVVAAVTLVVLCLTSEEPMSERAATVRERFFSMFFKTAPSRSRLVRDSSAPPGNIASDNKPAMSRNSLILLGLSVLFWLALLVAIDPSSLAPQAQRAAYRAAIYAAILCAASVNSVRQESPTDRQWIAVCGAVSVVVAVILFLQQVGVTLVPLWSRNPQRSVSYGNDCEPFQGYQSGEKTFDAFYRREGEDPFRARNVSVAKKHPLPQPQGLLAETTILSAEHASIPTQPVGVVNFRTTQELESSDFPRLRLKVEFDPATGPALFCPPERTMTQIDENERFVAYHLLDCAMRHAGFKRYILVPYGFYERNPALDPPVTTTDPAASTKPSPGTDR